MSPLFFCHCEDYTKGSTASLRVPSEASDAAIALNTNVITRSRTTKQPLPLSCHCEGGTTAAISPNTLSLTGETTKQTLYNLSSKYNRSLNS